MNFLPSWCVSPIARAIKRWYGDSVMRFGFAAAVGDALVAGATGEFVLGVDEARGLIGLLARGVETLQPSQKRGDA